MIESKEVIEAVAPAVLAVRKMYHVSCLENESLSEGAIHKRLVRLCLIQGLLLERDTMALESA